MDVWGGDITIYRLSIFGMVWYRITITSGPLRTARTAARAAGRSDLSDHSTVYSDSTYIQGAWDITATCGEYVREGE
jgi:hypothetical protein